MFLILFVVFGWRFAGFDLIVLVICGYFDSLGSLGI